MRSLLVGLVLLAGCTLYYDDHRQPMQSSVLPDAGEVCGPAPADAGSCTCTGGHWRCNTCPWPAPEAVIPCTQIGASCDYQDSAHGCACSCDASGYWSCTPETANSVCPHVPYPDAAL